MESTKTGIIWFHIFGETTIMIKRSHGGFRHPTILLWASNVVGGIGGLCFIFGWKAFGVFLIALSILMVVADLRVGGYL